MDNKKMIWSVLAHLEMSMWKNNTAVFDENVWDTLLDECVKAGINQIVMDIGRGIKFGSHPELSKDWSWSRQRVRKEVKRLRELGIEAIPKLNFSATHDGWLMEYERMMSTPTYYKVCRDLILEAGELFDNPRYIHLGMDEEDARHAAFSELAVYRHKDLLWHDLQFLFDCARETGATPWIWADHCLGKPDEFYEKIGTEDVVLSPWMYNSIKKEHWTSVKSRQAYIDYYAKEPYASMNIQYIEEEPFIQKFYERTLPYVNQGYSVVPCVSSINQCQYNAVDMLEYFKENVKEGKILGYMTAPWLSTTKNSRDWLLNDIRWFRQAIDKVYFGKTIDKKDIVSIEYDKIATDLVY